MTTKKILLSILLVFLVNNMVCAQEKASMGYTPVSLYTLSWTVSIPVGSFNDFTDQLSLAGGNLTGRYFVKKGLAAGFEFGWNSYYKKYPGGTYYGSDGTAVTATFYTYAFVIPWKVGLFYYFKPSSVADPYVGLSFGGDYMEEHVLVQEYDVYNTQWGFTLSPELGVLIKLGRFSRWAANVSAQYWLNTNSFSLTDSRTYSLMQGLNFNVGLAYVLR